jgi:hypothetical protein
MSISSMTRPRSTYSTDELATYTSEGIVFEPTLAYPKSLQRPFQRFILALDISPVTASPVAYDFDSRITTGTRFDLERGTCLDHPGVQQDQCDSSWLPPPSSQHLQTLVNYVTCASPRDSVLS